MLQITVIGKPRFRIKIESYFDVLIFHFQCFCKTGQAAKRVVIPHASHAVIAEQPDAVADALIAYARRLWP